MSRQSDQLIYDQATEYRGFHIDKQNRVFKDGKRVFEDSRFYPIYTEEEAKATIDLSADYIQPTYVPRNATPIEQEEFEAGAEHQQRFAEHVNYYHEQQLNNF